MDDRPPARLLPTRSPRRDLLVGAAVVVLHLALLRVLPGPAGRVVDDVSQLLLATAAAVACTVAARRSVPNGPRLAWWLLAVSWTAWAAGQAVYTVQVHLSGVPDPYPSASDAGFVVAVAAAGLGVVAWNAVGASRHTVLRDLLDGAIIAGSLLTLVWVVSLGELWSAGGVSGLGLVLSMLYPVGDVVLGTAALLAATRATSAGRVPLALLAASLTCLAVTDIVYLHATTTGSYDSGSLLSTGWVLAFVLVVVAARWPAVYSSPTTRTHRLRRWPQQALPYLPLVTTFPVLLVQANAEGTVPQEDLWVVIGLFALVLVRQLVVLRDNRALVRALRRDAHVDPLTGLENRRSVEARLVASLTAHAAQGSFGSVAVLMCDVDGLKRANDQHGHDAGDEVLKHVSALLRRAVTGCVPDLPRDVLVGRIGGDEFALVLTDAAAERTTDLRTWISAHADELPYGAGLSIGSGRLTSAPPNVQTPQEMMRILLRLADGELYAQKPPERSDPLPAVVAARATSDELAALVRRVQTGLDHVEHGPGSTAARLGVVASAFARTSGACAWWVSAVTAAGTLDDVLRDQVRAPVDPVAPVRPSDLTTSVHRLADYPASEAAAHGRSAGFHVTPTSGDPAERTYLATAGYAQALGSGGLDEHGHAWLVEVYGDAGTADLGEHLPMLAALVTMALRERTPTPPAADEIDVAVRWWSMSH